jgi:hypothetical protein
MKSALALAGLWLLLVLIAPSVQAQTSRSTDDPRNLAPTVMGGTGLFTVYDAQTLRRGEFNFGFFANHFHREPGNVRIQTHSLNFQVGFSDHFEFFVNWEVQKQHIVGAPALLSGFYLPDVRTKTLPSGRVVIVPGTNSISVLQGDPCGNGGFPGPCTVIGNPLIGPFTARPSGNDTAVYPGLGAPVGGILPAIPPNVLPSYLPNAPFLARFAGTGQGDIWFGGKIRLTGPNNPFGFALIPVLKIPTTRELNPDLQRGRTTGAIDYGLIAAFDSRLHRYINLSSNVGFIKKGDPRAEDMNLGPLCQGCGVIRGFGNSERALDLPNEFRSGLAFDFPVSQYLQFIVELSSTHYVGSRTPSLLRNDPVDLVLGARIYPARWLSIGSAYQRHLNWFSELSPRQGGHSPNGFIANVSIGHVNERVEPVVPNQPPTVTLEVGAVTPVATNVRRESASTVCVSDTVALRAIASDPDGDTLLYSWTSTGGRIIGEGANVSLDTTGLAPGDYTVTVQVDDGCGCVAFDSRTIRVSDCPPLTICFNPYLNVTPASSTVQAGEAVTFTTPGVTGGQNYGNVSYSWTASAGIIAGTATSARLDTTGVAPGTTIEVRVTAASDIGDCSASGSARVTIATPPPPPPRPTPRELTPCTTFRRNSARVDNACKAILQDVARQLQADPQAQLVVDSYRAAKERKGIDLQRGKNVRDRLADGSVGIAIDPNRIVVRPGDVSTTGDQVKLYFVPAGASLPPGPEPATLGSVQPERRVPARRRRR